MSVELTEALLAKAAGWDVMKRARAYIEQGQVASSYWAPPLLRGVVQNDGMSFRASMVIHNDIDIENLCNCREAREWGKICAHSVAVGLHWLKSQKPEAAPTPTQRSPALPARKNSALLRAANGESAELFIILPPNFDQAIARGKITLMLEAKWAGGRVPLNALPKGRTFAFSPQDNEIIEQLEILTNGETPALLQLETKDFVVLLPLLAEHENITLGKTTVVTVTKAPFNLPLCASLEANGEIILTLKDKTKANVMIGNWIWQKNTLQPLGLPPDLQCIFRAPVRVTRSQVPQFLSQLWPQLSAAGSVEANFKLEDFTQEPQTPRFLLALKGGLTQLSALLQCAYGSRIMTAGVTAADENVWLPDPEVPTRYSTRDFSAERAAVARLQRSGFSAPDGQGKLQLLGQNSVLNFLAREFPRLQREWSVTLDEQSNFG